MFKRWWSYLSKIGVRDGYDVVEEKEIVLNNKINLFIIIVFIFLISIDIVEYFSIDGLIHEIYFLRTALIIASAFFHLFLNSIGKHKISKILLFFDIPFILFYFAPIFGAVVNDYYFWFPYIPIALSIIPILLYSARINSIPLYCVLFVYLLHIILSYPILSLFSHDQVALRNIVGATSVYYIVVPVLIFIFVDSTLLYYVNVLNKSEKLLVKSQIELSEKNKELKNVNTDLTKLNLTKDKFFRIIGHDLKAPVLSMIQVAEILEEQIDTMSQKTILNLVTSIKEASSMGYKLLSNLLDWSRSQTGAMICDPEEVYLNSVVERCIDVLSFSASIKNITIKIEVSEHVKVFADINMLLSIFRNLISNAIKFSYDNSVVTISAFEKENNVDIMVTDRGIGMTEDEISELFQIDILKTSLGTNNERGTGLGLVLCKEFVDKNNGTISVTSTKNKGSEFTVTLPKM